MLLEQFKPDSLYITINTERYRLNEFTLGVMVSCTDVFGDLEEFKKLIDHKTYGENGVIEDKFFDNFSELAWILLVGKDLFPSKCKFRELLKPTFGKKTKIDDELKTKFDNYLENISVIYSIIERAQPLNYGDDEPSTNVTKPETKTEVTANYAELYVYVSEKIKYTVDEFYDLTLRQIFAIRKELLKIETKRFKLKAKMMGIPVKDDLDKTTFTETEDKAFKDESSRQYKQLMKGLNK